MRVLFATDGFKPAREGEQLITELFTREGVSIDVVCVEPEPLDEVVPLDTYLEMKRLDMPVLGAEAVAHEAAERLGAAGFETTFKSRRGDPSDELIEVLEQGSYDLIVLGASHGSWLGNALLGSVSTHVLHHSPTSVLLTHRAPTGSGKVLFGVDGSKGASSAVELCSRLLDPARCTAHIATVVSHPIATAEIVPPGVFPFPAPSYDPTRERDRIEGGRRVGRGAATTLTDAGFRVEGTVLLGRAGPHLLKEADNIGADLVVVGSRGLGAVRRAVLGSVGEQVARHASAALVVRSHSS
jgi:nucleotide-binding universal stress UspA family protein